MPFVWKPIHELFGHHSNLGKRTQLMMAIESYTTVSTIRQSMSLWHTLLSHHRYCPRPVGAS